MSDRLRTREETPDTWSPMDLTQYGDVWVHVPDHVKPGDTGKDVLVYHWHMPTNGPHFWSLASCGLHTVESVEPLSMHASLACADGCPNHGWLKAGVWTRA